MKQTEFFNFQTSTIYKFIGGLILAICFAGITATDAQTTNRKKKRTVQPVATQTPTVTLTVPEIISRAGETPDEPPIIYLEPEESPETTENPDELKNKVTELNAKIKSLEQNRKDETDGKEKRILLSLDILTRAETRAESLRKQLFEILEKENSVQARIEQIQFDMRPDMISSSMATIGSLKPEDLRDSRKKSLESEKRNLENLLTQIQTNRQSLERSVERADQLVEKIRLKFEKQIDEALIEEEDQ